MNVVQALALINKCVRGLSAYHLEPEQPRIKLNQNENPFDWPEPLKREILDFCLHRPWNRYPDFVPAQLKETLASYTGLSAANIIVGNGSNEMLLVLLIALSQDGGAVIINQPTFTVYSLLANGLNRPIKSIWLTPEPAFDVEALCRAASENQGAVMILCSPNNPTGNSLSEKDLRELLAVHQGFLLLDQAYVEFGGYNAVPLLKEHPNLIITRTFSKAIGGAGLRLGYLLGTAEVVAELNKIKLPYNINFLSDHIATELLNHRTLIEERVAEIAERRDNLYAFLKTLPLTNVYPSAANFILIRYKKKDDLFGFLRNKGILLRDVSGYPTLEGCLRVSVGTADEDKALQNALSEYFR
ncbi:MAG: histidinol-phosphate transaminase [Chitinivibrionales bacterium]|nr:histidinol-phosphate transaminase [Chitinivibrionales bacterium]MBD3358379.1 histidinol-phosphate transaminase [Chitinivibrionales bacterium]